MKANENNPASILAARAAALADDRLVDVTHGFDLDFTCPVACTPTVWVMIGNTGARPGTDVAEVCALIATRARVACQNAPVDAPAVAFEVSLADRTRRLTLHIHAGETDACGMTITFEGEPLPFAAR